MVSRKVGVAFVLLAAFVLPARAAAQTISCPENGSGGDQVTRGFYVQSFPGTTLGTVRLRYYGGGDGTYTVALTARTSTYDGAVVGTVQQTFAISGNSPQVTFDFGNAPATQGAALTFSQSLVASPGGVAFYDTGTGPCPGIVQTNGTTPPLDTVRRDSVGVLITYGTAVPTMNEWVMLVLGTFLVGAVAYRIRRWQFA